MKKDIIINGNQTFFILTVGIAFGISDFVDAVLDSSLEQNQLETDLIGQAGYIRIDSSPVRSKNDGEWKRLIDKIREGFLGILSYEFSSSSKFDGVLSEKVTFKREGYKFELKIKEYERDEEHEYSFISSEVALSEDIPDDEELGRVVYLTISLDED